MISKKILRGLILMKHYWTKGNVQVSVYSEDFYCLHYNGSIVQVPYSKGFLNGLTTPGKNEIKFQDKDLMLSKIEKSLQIKIPDYQDIQEKFLGKLRKVVSDIGVKRITRVKGMIIIDTGESELIVEHNRGSFSIVLNGQSHSYEFSDLHLFVYQLTEYINSERFYPF